jgi:hypothetical protein
MLIFTRIFVRLWFVCLAAIATTAYAQSLVGSWLATVEGDPSTRTLVIAAEAPTDSGALLSARYGITGKGITPIEATVSRVANRRQMNLVTQAATIIAVTEQADGTFAGTFFQKNGIVKNVSFARVSDAELAASAQPKTMAIQPTGASVPPECAAFSGIWGGEWPSVGFTSLWVVRVDEDCSAKVVYVGGTVAPKANRAVSDAKIKSGVLYLARPDGGTTTFDITSGEMRAQYQGPGGANSAVMQKLDFNSFAQLATDTKALSTLIPPASNVPPHCSALHGVWSGKPSQGNFSTQYLRVVEIKLVDEKCVARVSYSSSKLAFPARDTAEIQNGILTFICNKTTNGTCSFDRKSDELWMSYSNSVGGTNNGVFKKQE